MSNPHKDPCPNYYSVTTCQQKKTATSDRVRNLFSARVSLAERRLTRQRKFRYLSDHELGLSHLRERSRSSPASPESAVQKLRLSGEGGRGHWSFSAEPKPLPLPLPESLAGRKETDHQNNPSKNSTKSFQTHPYSPNLGPKRATISVSPASPLRSPASDIIMCSSPAPHNSHETKKPLKPLKWRASYSCKSAPTSPVASPRRAGLGDVSTYFALAAREFPDMQTGNVTRKIIRDASKTQKAVSFPMRKKSSVSEEDNNSHANAHPLPLPPGVINAVLPMRGHWKKGKLIGRGTFGSVYLGTNSETGALCAMKEVDLVLDDPKSVECIRQLEQEIRILRQLKHPNIVQYYGSEVVDDHFYIYLEYVHPGSINKYVRERCGAVTESVVRNFTRHILSGLAYLHSTKTIHRDIKGANLLVDSSGVVKLADFGMAKHLTGPSYDLSLKGSPYWMAPEVIKAAMLKNASSCLALAVDVWSLGCTVIEMMNGKPPWSEFTWPQAMFRVLNNTPPIPEALSSEGKDFLNCCFRRNPADRPSAAKLLEHAFVRNSHHHHHHHHHHHQISPTAHGCLATSIMEKLNIQSGVSPTPTPSARMGISNGSPLYCGNNSSPWTLSL